jgi:hypothetical protein
MVNLALAWAERYQELDPTSISVTGELRHRDCSLINGT